jgi:hypothetical protein
MAHRLFADKAAFGALCQAELSVLLDGRPVDLRTAQDLSRYFRDDVVRTAGVLFEAR